MTHLRHPARRAVLGLLAPVSLLPGLGWPRARAAAGTGWGTPERPFSAQSPWNARPLSPVLGTFEIPKSGHPPSISQGRFSTGVFVAGAQDQPVRIHALPGKTGVWDPDAERHRASIEIPRWPEGVLPASGPDGHAEVIDAVAGIVHSFWKLRQLDGRWCAAQYAWTRLDGRGWGEPAHYFQGARAAGVPALGGLIRQAEVNDGQPLYRHALALSLTYNALAADPAYIYPATSADSNASRSNSGQIPEGALLTLPPDFDIPGLSDARVRKVAQTLKVYGAYVVDRNVGTPFTIYVENGSDFALHRPRWNNAIARDLDRMRAALRQVVAVSGWIDGNGAPMRMERRFNLLSLRGPWRVQEGSAAPGVFDTWRQAVVFPAGAAVTQSSAGGHPVSAVAWARPRPGLRYRLSAEAAGGGTLQLRLVDPVSQDLRFDSGALAHAQQIDFPWPAAAVRATLILRSAGADAPTAIRGHLVLRDDDAGPAR